MNHRDRIEDLEQRIYFAYQEGDYQQAKMLENEVKKLKGQKSLFDSREPYSIEGRIYPDE
ncbi:MULTISPECIES: hypothetical protein [Photobacterium]|uniref:Uncharacterized protein n=1 Tax=Photobacterium ganghwense TaxID=320778 RepID=A0A0J1HFN6_9GAMM|nr:MULTISPECIES: hypothetical protein [Photobacterium]KLV10433.1 hypothetical protein ABT57_07760 [Photobacterium ganghwense]MBV1841333.1 hypothetical protein [Photobacterium ganghwense]PSU09670.1 hypothetical protein C9I92_09130 [Photobacterium ganghwense]QSV16917.1 hypothetical protein FH974_18340 [Photobacterium ganghwense]